MRTSTDRRSAAGLGCATCLASLALAMAAEVSTQVAVDTRPLGPRVEAAADLPTVMGGRDPLEGLNRVAYHGSNVFIRYVYRPVGSGYSTIMPRWGVRHINYFTDNLEFIPRMCSCFLQGRTEDGGIEMLRFVTNSTVGIAGFFEVAEGWNLPRQDEDFGQAFAAWGVGPGCSLYAVSPTNARDAVGAIFDFALDPKTYVNGGQAFTFLNDGIEVYPQYDRIWRESYDPYWSFRELKLVQRQLQVSDWSPAKVDPSYVALTPSSSGETERLVNGIRARCLAGDAWQGPVIDTLRVGMFKVKRAKESAWTYLSPFNTDFEQMGQVRSVQVAETATGRSAMPYKFWEQEDSSAPLVIILPGLGSHYSSSTGAAMAELVHDHGCAAAVMSNAMNWEFVETATIEKVPGFTPDDAQSVRRAIAAVLSDLRKHRGLSTKRIMLVGFSLGALDTLFVADLERREPTLGITRYVAVNPPVNLLHGMEKLDEFSAGGDGWDEAETVDRVTDAAGHYLAMITSNSDAPLPIGEDAAKVLIGYSFRRSLRDLVASMHHREPLAALQTPYAWGDRQRLYHELSHLGFEWYLDQVLIPYYEQKQGRPVTLDELDRYSGLHAIETTLREHPDIRVIHSADDFLQTDADRAFLQDAFGSRIRFFDHGSHLGNLHVGEVQQCILQELNLETATAGQ